VKRELSSRLLSWFDARRRDLPWRNDPDPYRVWVSEVMLQQTRVEAVVPYYLAWLRRFPSIDALADADLGEVLKGWEGLGYYARARNLHRAARLVRERHGGQLPADPEALRALPGIGEYTAGAIASIAFGLPVPAVDGNVRRVLSRLFDLEDPTPVELRRLAAELVPADRPGDFNQALMELGATTCTPRSPACEACPAAELCRARAAGTQAERPRRRRAKPLPEDGVGTAVVVSPAGRVLLTRRPEHGLLGGLWEFPGEPATRGEDPVTAAARAARAVVGEHLAPGTLLGSVVHTFSHRRTTYHAVRFAALAEPRLEPPAVWAAPDELDRFALPAAQQRIAALALEAQGRQAASAAGE
jgi:A/G-specific adenine glycosylase